MTGGGKQRYYCRECRRYFRENPAKKESTVEKKKRIPSNAIPSKGHLILKLQAIAQRIGRTPTTADINRLSKINQSYPLYLYQETFGGFNAALTKANLPLRYNQTFDKDKLIAELRVLRRKLKRALIAKDVQAARKRGEVSSLYHFQRAFGSVPLAIGAAGSARRDYSRAEIINYLKVLSGELSRLPTGRDISSRFTAGETPSLKEILKLFGSVTLARKAAGIE